MIGTADLSLAQAAGRANPIYLEGKLLPLAASAARDLGLKDGDVVQALVQARGGNDMALLLRGRLLDLPPNSNLNAGQSLNLQVQMAPNGALTLVPLAGPPAAGAALPLLGAGAAAVFSRVGNLLFRPPGQPSLAQLFSPGVLDALLKNSPRLDLQTQWRSMQLSMAQITPQALSQAVAAAMGSEVMLARGLPALPGDTKQLLRRLLGELDESRAEEGDNLIEGLGDLQRGIEEIEASQVQAVQAQAQREMLFSMMLPFADAEPVELVFRRAPRQGDAAPPLVVNVHSRSQALGEIWLKTQLNGGDKVELTMWALNGAVVEQARQRSAELGQQLGDAGLAMQSFQIMHGARPAQPADWVPSGRGMVVDVSA